MNKSHHPGKMSCVFGYNLNQRASIFLTLLSITLVVVRAQPVKKTFVSNGQIVYVEKLNKEIEEILDKTNLPGLSFAIIDQNKVVFYNTYGFRKFEEQKDGAFKGKKKVNKKTVFEACSLSKNFFAFAVHKLVDNGRLKLDTPMHHYLAYPRLEHDERYKKITPRMILTHSSGIENWAYYNHPDTLEIVGEPGENFVYSGEGYMYLARVVEKILGKPIERYMEELVFEPLNLKNTYSVYKGRTPNNYSTGHNSFRYPFPKEKNKNPNIAGLISTTAKDYAELLIAFFSGKHLSQSRMYELTRTGKMVGEGQYFGPGFAVGCYRGDTLLFQLGDNDKFKAFGLYSKNRKSGYVFFTNGERGEQIMQVLENLTHQPVEHDIFEDFEQFPNFVFKILNFYNERGTVEVRKFFGEAVKKEKAPISEENFHELCYLFLEEEPQLSLFFIEQYKDSYPNSQEAFILSGDILVKHKRYKEAKIDFQKALNLEDGDGENLKTRILMCDKNIKSWKSKEFNK